MRIHLLDDRRVAGKRRVLLMLLLLIMMLMRQRVSPLALERSVRIAGRSFYYISANKSLWMIRRENTSAKLPNNNEIQRKD